jgi:hypothetical protein
MASGQEPAAPSGAQETVSVQTAAEHDTLLAAIYQFEQALASAAPGREPDWARRVATDLGVVQQELARHRRSAEAADGLLAELAQAMPTAQYQLGKLREAHGAMLDEAAALLTSVAQLSEDATGSVDAIRRRSAALLLGLHHHQWQEVDLVYEAFDRDLGGRG